jgi:hypothetical protein
MARSEINLKIVRLAVHSVLDHLIEDLGLENVSIDDAKDFYWDCPAPEIYDSSKKPQELTVGRLSDDAHFVGSIQRGQSGEVRCPTTLSIWRRFLGTSERQSKNSDNTRGRSAYCGYCLTLVTRVPVKRTNTVFDGG